MTQVIQHEDKNGNFFFTYVGGDDKPVPVRRFRAQLEINKGATLTTIKREE